MAVQPKYILNDLENDIFATVVSFYGKIYTEICYYGNRFSLEPVYISVYLLKHLINVICNIYLIYKK